VFGLAAVRTNDELIEEELRTDAAFRAEWKRAALGRMVAIAIVRYRADHDLSQADMADRLGMTLPQLARLELSEVNPNRNALMRILDQLGVEFKIDPVE
jgi:ribosome-binding protein aMBF1 (putative translation factor)